MMETALMTPFIMVMIVLMIYLGWNYRRLAQITNMDRYAVWKEVTPGSTGPNRQGLQLDMRNPQLNSAFFDLQSDRSMKLAELDNNEGYMPLGHELIRDDQSDETYAYFDEFLDRSPRGIRERFQAEHEQISDWFDSVGMSNLTRTAEGHSRLNGDWRYANGIRFNSARDRWDPAGYRVTPGESLREVFFAEMDDGLEPYANNGNNLARAVREFYLSYPSYVGPDINDGANRGSGFGRWGGRGFTP